MFSKIAHAERIRINDLKVVSADSILTIPLHRADVGTFSIITELAVSTNEDSLVIVVFDVRYRNVPSKKQLAWIVWCCLS